MHLKLQHYVPQFYLKYFGDKLHVFDKELEKTFSTSVRNISAENYFYEIPRGMKTVENLFSKMESDFNSVCLELLDKLDPDDLSEESRRLLAFFIAIQYLRTKEKREMVKSTGNLMLNKIIEWLKLTDVKASMTEEGVKALHIKFMLENSGQFAQIISEMKWTICVNHTNIPFWTSDNPVTLHNSIDQSPLGNLGLKSEGIEIHFPINPELSLITCDPNSRLHKLLPTINVLTNSDYISKQRVIFENSLQVQWSTKFVFSPNDEFSLVRRILKDTPLLKDPNRPRVIVK